MTHRVTQEEVKAIIPTEIEDISPFIQTAHVLLNKTLASETDDELLKEIEKWLSAHYVAIADPRVRQIKIGDVTETYYGRSGEGLSHTPYGQQVLALDTTGSFALLSKTKASFGVIKEKWRV